MNIRDICYFILLIFGIQATGISQIINGDFENWQDSLVYNPAHDFFIDSAVQARPLDWKHEYNFNDSPVGYYRTTDAASGKYAVVIHTWYGYFNTAIRQEDTISVKPSSLSGSYKYLMKLKYSDSTDVAKVYIDMINSEGEVIGSGNGSLDTISNYTEFTVPIEYSSGDEVASYLVKIKNSEFGCKSFENICKYLYLDDIKFNYTTSTSKQLLAKQVNAFPNPSNGIVYFSAPFKSCSLYNLQGQLIEVFHDNNEIMLPSLRGLYILVSTTKEGLNCVHKVKRI